MPAGQPFIQLCQQLAHLRAESNRADLHLHTCHSDGVWTPAEVVARAQRRGLGAIAITDHDTCAGVAAAQTAAGAGWPAIDVICGIEITCDHLGRELHLLAYFLSPNDPYLGAALAQMREQRLQRFQEMVERLRRQGITLNVDACLASGAALGRQHLAALLVQADHARTLSEAFMRYLRDGGSIAVPKRGLPVADAIALVRGAAGVTSWAHPPPEVALEQLVPLRDLGLDALEVEYPSFRKATTNRLRDLAHQAGLAVSGGSDCHGPTPVTRAIGTCAVTRRELEALRELAARNGRYSDARAKN